MHAAQLLSCSLVNTAENGKTGSTFKTNRSKSRPKLMLKASYLTEKRTQVKDNNKSTLVSLMQFYYTVTTTCFGHSCGHLQGGNSKNTDIFTVCRDYSTVKNHTGLIKIPVKWNNSDEYKTLEAKNCFLLYIEGTSGGL
jgi:hypothetical protein